MAQSDQLLFEERRRHLLGGARQPEMLGGTVFRFGSGDGRDRREVPSGFNRRRATGWRSGVLPGRRDRLCEQAAGRAAGRYSSAGDEWVARFVSEAASP